MWQGIATMLEDLGNLGDFIGGIAVIATLIYLALQVRNNTRSTEAQALASWATLVSASNTPMMSDPTFIEDYRATLAKTEPEFISPAETRVNLWLIQCFMNFQTIFYMSKAGAVASEMLETQVFYLQTLLANPGAQYWWNTYAKNVYTAEFIDFVETKIAT